MRWKVNALRERLEAVPQVLRSRAVRMLRTQRHGPYLCLQCEGRLAALLGLEEQIRCLSAGSAEVACRFERYEPTATA